MKPGSEAMHKEVVLAFWKVHILHHASIQPIYGQWMLQELRRHDFDLSPARSWSVWPGQVGCVPHRAALRLRAPLGGNTR